MKPFLRAYFLAKLSSSGEHLWSTPLPVAASIALAVDPSGNAVVVGNTGDDVYVVSFWSDGGQRWEKTFGCADGGGVAGSVAVDSVGNVVLVGTYRGTVNFGDPCWHLTSEGNNRAFVAKLSTSGACRWAKDFGNEQANASGVTSVVADNSVAVTGSFTNTIDLGAGVRTSAGAEDVFVVNLSSSGEHVWSETFGGSAADYGAAIADTSDGVVLAGFYYSESIDLGGGPRGDNPDGSNHSDLYVAKLALNGAHVWSKSFGSAGYDFVGREVGVDADDNIILAGSFESPISFGGPTLSGAGGSDIFVAKLSPSGTHDWSHWFGERSSDSGQGVAVDSNGRAVVIGDFSGTVDLGGSTLTSAGDRDICIFTVAP
jgi:hypothetical protein